MGTESGKASQSKRHVGRILKGALGWGTDKDDRSDQTVLWKKSKCFESTAHMASVLLQGAWGGVGGGGPICFEKEGSEITMKRFRTFRQAFGSPQDLPGNTPWCVQIKEWCPQKVGFSSSLRGPISQSLTPHKARWMTCRGGGWGEAFLKRPLALASCIERILDLYRPVNNLRSASSGGSPANEACQPPKDQQRLPYA